MLAVRIFAAHPYTPSVSFYKASKGFAKSPVYRAYRSIEES
jgi:hypothetical protein